MDHSILHANNTNNANMATGLGTVSMDRHGLPATSRASPEQLPWTPRSLPLMGGIMLSIALFLLSFADSGLC